MQNLGHVEAITDTQWFWRHRSTFASLAFVRRLHADFVSLRCILWYEVTGRAIIWHQYISPSTVCNTGNDCMNLFLQWFITHKKLKIHVYQQEFFKLALRWMVAIHSEARWENYCQITRILTWFWHGNKVSRLWDGTTGLSDAYYKGNIVFQNYQYKRIMITIFTMVSRIFIFVHILRLLEVRCNVKSTTFEIWTNFQQANRISSFLKIINGMRILLGLVIQEHDVTDSSEW